MWQSVTSSGVLVGSAVAVGLKAGGSLVPVGGIGVTGSSVGSGMGVDVASGVTASGVQRWHGGKSPGVNSDLLGDTS